MANRNIKAFIVEGEAREPQVITNISRIFFAHDDFKIITLPAGENIYMLWKKLKVDDFDTDIIEVLRETNNTLREQLLGMSRTDFSEIYLFFDYDAHQTNLAKTDGDDVIRQMLESFDNETENGKLYISYPMVEALRDYHSGTCGNSGNCYVTLEDIRDYKNISAERSLNPHFKDYSFDNWKDIIDIFAMRLSCLIGTANVMTYEQYLNQINPLVVFLHEASEMLSSRVFILSAFPEFLVDYFGIRLWKTSVKHTKYHFDRQRCR